MMYPQIRPYHEGAPILPNSFFILRDGPDAGRPYLVPVENCYIVCCTYPHYHDFFFWLTYALFIEKKFKTHHRGLIHQFVDKEQIRSLIRQNTPLIYSDWQRFQEILYSMNTPVPTLAEQILASTNLHKRLF